MVTRRRVVIALGAGAIAPLAPLAAFAQQQRVYRVGVLAGGTSETSRRSVDAVVDGLRNFGYVEGKNVSIEKRFADGHLDRLPALAADLVQQKVDVIVALGGAHARAAKQATATVPIVFASLSDPIGQGLTASFARPGGNITGISTMGADVSAKRLQLLKEAFPKISRVAVFVAPDSAAGQITEVQRGAKVLGIEVLLSELQRLEEFEQRSAQLRKWRADSMLVLESNRNFFNRKLLVELAAKMRLPALFGSKQYADAGGLMSYGANYEAQYRYAATFVSKILKGAKPADLPVEQATEFELAINMKTAKTLGFKFPNSILAQVTKVIG